MRHASGKLTVSIMTAAVLGAGLLAAAASPVLAQVSEPPIAYSSPGADSAMIIGRPGREAQNMYPVEIIAVNDRDVVGQRQVIWLEPGKYTVTVRALIRNPPGTTYRSRGQRNDGYNEIDLVVEAGKTYHILAQYDPTRRDSPYNTVLYRVADGH